MIELLIKLVLIGFCSFCAILDLKYRKLPLTLIIISGSLLFIFYNPFAVIGIIGGYVGVELLRKEKRFFPFALIDLIYFLHVVALLFINYVEHYNSRNLQMYSAFFITSCILSLILQVIIKIKYKLSNVPVLFVGWPIIIINIIFFVK